MFTRVFSIFLFLVPNTVVMSRTNGKRRKPGKRPPILVKEGSVVVRLRFSPRKTNGTWYDSCLVDYSNHGKRCRDRKNSFRKARTWAKTVAVKIANGEMQSLALTGEDRKIYLTSCENIKGLKVPLDAATREYADAKRLAKNADLREVSRFYNRYAQKGIKPIQQESGNSDRDIEDNYLELATEEEAEDWFAIAPTPERLKELHALASELREYFSAKQVS